MSDERQFEPLKHYFTETELSRMKNDLVSKVGEVRSLRSDKTQTLAQMATNIKATEKQVFDLQEKISLTYEVLDIEVFSLMNTPRPGLKRIVRVDNNEILREEPMSLREQQDEFDFGAPPERPPAEG